MENKGILRKRTEAARGRQSCKPTLIANFRCVVNTAPHGTVENSYMLRCAAPDCNLLLFNKIKAVARFPP
jgi:hypothetical protein